MTVSAYIRYREEIPDSADFESFEKELIKTVTSEFEDSEEDHDKFNTAFGKLMNMFGIAPGSCRVVFETNIENSDPNLHSFFINDLESAKNIDTPNLASYLSGGSFEGKIDLDSKKESPKFAPDVFKSILEPENYPLGRFPSTTKFALSFMQQVAVNLSAGYDKSTIRSVNGPPGTGKTTLLKDIFAHLAVQQAYDICKLENRTSAAKDLDKSLPQIGRLPDCIAENNIVVASSNNGAVQNIVKELPLMNAVDPALLDELKSADYFFELSNSQIEDSKDEKGNSQGKDISLNPELDKWGLYSLEGGKKENMDNILSYVNEACEIISMEYEEEPDIYEKFLEQYKNVHKMRAEAKSHVMMVQRESSDSNDIGKPLDMDVNYEALQLSNPWFTEKYRIEQSKLFIISLRVRKQYLFENRRNLRHAIEIWEKPMKYANGEDTKMLYSIAWGWINFTVPVISSTFASFSRMCRNLSAGSIGHLFVDEAGQAVPQAAVGAIYRSSHVMVVGDPAQIKPVVTLDMSIMTLLGKRFGVTEKYLSDSASVQTLVDSTSKYGYFRSPDKEAESWIGIPLWVHRRCNYPMFTIANMISYDGLMVQGKGNSPDAYGCTGWYDVSGTANDKFVQEQANFLSAKIMQLSEKYPEILDHNAKDKLYVITPFRNIAYKLSKELDKIGFTRREGNKKNGKPTNIGTIHTFQGKEADIVFMVLGADFNSKGSAKWAVTEPNMMNVAATRAKKEFYIVADKNLYKSLHTDVAETTIRCINIYKKHHPELVDEDVETVMSEYGTKVTAAKSYCYEHEAPPPEPEIVPASYPTNIAQTAAPEPRQTPEKAQISSQPEQKSTPQANGWCRKTGTVISVGESKKRKGSYYAYIMGADGTKYTVTDSEYDNTVNASQMIAKGKAVSFTVNNSNGRCYANNIQPCSEAAPEPQRTSEKTSATAQTVQKNTPQENVSSRKTGTVTSIGESKTKKGSYYAFIKGSDGTSYIIPPSEYARTENAAHMIVKGKVLSFTVFRADNGKYFANNIQPCAEVAPEPQRTSEKASATDQTVQKNTSQADGWSPKTGTVTFLCESKNKKGSYYAYIMGSDETKYTVTDSEYDKTENASKVIVKGNKVSFAVYSSSTGKPCAKNIKPL